MKEMTDLDFDSEQKSPTRLKKRPSKSSSFAVVDMMTL